MSGALYEMPAGDDSRRVFHHTGCLMSWSTSADESAAKAKELGATLMKEPFDVLTLAAWRLFRIQPVPCLRSGRRERTRARAW